MCIYFFFSSRRRHTRFDCDWSSDVCSSDLAQCHNHPFDKWTQDDYYDWADVFARVNYKVLENRRRDNNDGHEFKGEQIVYVADKGEVKNPRSGKAAHPRFLGQARPLTQPATRDTEDAADSDGLDALAEW